MGLEPTTFCMASRRSSQLSYSRARPSIDPSIRASRSARPPPRGPWGGPQRWGRGAGRSGGAGARASRGCPLRRSHSPLRRRPESNRCRRLCRPLRNHSATSPRTTVKASGAIGSLGPPRAISSAGRAPPRQGGGRWFEPSIAHRGIPAVEPIPARSRPWRGINEASICWRSGVARGLASAPTWHGSSIHTAGSFA